MSYITTSGASSENCSFFPAAAKGGRGASSAMKMEGLAWGISEKAEAAASRSPIPPTSGDLVADEETQKEAQETRSVGIA